MSAENEYVNLEIADNIATITLDRPETSNAMFPPFSEELLEIVTEVNESSVRVAVVRGSDESGTFTSGGDLSLTPEEFMEDVDIIKDVVTAIYGSPVVYIAEIKGAAMGGGLEFAAACDLRFVSTDATLGVPEVSIGVFPGVGGTRLLPRLVGMAAAKELILTGKHVSGQEAEEMGLATTAVPPAELRAEVEKLATDLASHSPAALGGALQSIHNAFDATIEDGLKWDREYVHRLVNNPDFEEGLAAFREGRDPAFEDRS